MSKRRHTMTRHDIPKELAEALLLSRGILYITLLYHSVRVVLTDVLVGSLLAWFNYPKLCEKRFRDIELKDFSTNLGIVRDIDNVKVAIRNLIPHPIISLYVLASNTFTLFGFLLLPVFTPAIVLVSLGYYAARCTVLAERAINMVNTLHRLKAKNVTAAMYYIDSNVDAIHKEINLNFRPYLNSGVIRYLERECGMLSDATKGVRRETLDACSTDMQYT